MIAAPSAARLRPRTGRVTVLVAASTLALIDLAAKAASEARLAGKSVDLGIIQLRLAFNSGVAFSIGDRLPAAVVVVVTAAVSVALAIYAWRRAPHAGSLEQIAGGAVIGGAAANVLDRARDGVVTDYLHTGWWPTFNLADTFLVTGFIVIALLHARAQRATHAPEPVENHPRAPRPGTSDGPARRRGEPAGGRAGGSVPTCREADQ